MYEKERSSMVEFQLKNRGIENPYVIEVMNTLPRHEFIPEISKSMAYGDFAVPIGQGQTISQPYIVAKFAELAQPRKSDKILEIGTGSGYMAAILAKLAGKVISIERNTKLADQAKKVTKKLGIKNLRVIVGDGSIGAIHYYPFDKIIISAAIPEIPTELIQQLKNNGVIVAPVGDRMKQKITKLIKTPSGIKETTYGECAFVPLLGKNGFKL